MNGPGAVWVFHRGALGDSVLLWPRLRMEVRAGRRVVLVTDREKARLAEREVGVAGMDAEQPRFNALWRDGPPAEGDRWPEVDVERVICAGGGGDPDGAWGRNVRRAFPAAALEVIGRPNRLLYPGLDPGAHPAARRNPAGPVVAHVGAGSEAKRWPLQRWATAIQTLRAAGAEVRAIAGEVERVRLSGAERGEFERLGGVFIDELQGLADTIREARLFVGCDSGPTHLAAAMGVPTLALFGPTDPRVWGPIGPSVRVVAPTTPRRMEWLGWETLVRAVGHHRSLAG